MRIQFYVLNLVITISELAWLRHAGGHILQQVVDKLSHARYIHLLIQANQKVLAQYPGHRKASGSEMPLSGIDEQLLSDDLGIAILILKFKS